jgi:FAD/FMN-containing dehydrogenase
MRSRVTPRERHAEKVARIARQLRQRRSSRPVSLRKRAVSHKVPRRVDAKAADDRLDVSDLDEILHVDPERRLCLAECGVTFRDLVAATLPHGLAPAVVPELESITVGGAVAGCSLESSSFRFGGFHDSCLEYEVVTAQGDVLTCTPANENSLVFQMVHGTFGTLGIITRLAFRLVPAKPFVRVTYERHHTFSDYQAAIERHFAAGDVDFMDGIIHSPTLYVLSTARFMDHAPYTSSYQWMKVYYQSTAERGEDYLETSEYFFRYDRGVTNVHPKSAIGRLLFGRFFGSSRLLRLAERVPWLLPSSVTLDVFVPFSRAPEFLAWFEREFGFFPLWCVPYRRVRDYEWITPDFYRRLDDDLFLDLAIYGMKQRTGQNAYKVIEDKLLEIGGLKTLISHNYFSEDDFWRIWNRDTYEAVKRRTDPHRVFRDLYEKTCRQSSRVLPRT